MACKYCNEPTEYLIRDDYISAKIDIDNEIEIKYQDGRETEYEWIRIDYCPKCGRKLKED